MSCMHLTLSAGALFHHHYSILLFFLRLLTTFHIFPIICGLFWILASNVPMQFKRYRWNPSILYDNQVSFCFRSYRGKIYRAIHPSTVMGYSVCSCHRTYTDTDRDERNWPLNFHFILYRTTEWWMVGDVGVGGFRIFLLYLAWLHFAFVFHYVLVLIHM